MDSGIYAAYTGLLARTQSLDMAANNLANAGTNGFRAQRDFFQSALATGLGTGVQASQVGNTVNSFGVLGGSLADLGQGPMVPTANPLDLALNGTGYFAVQTARGIRYTRDGSFTLSPAGQLQTQRGEAVLDQAMKPITLPSGTVEVSPDGTVSVQGSVVDQLGMFDFAQPQALLAEGASRFTAGSQTPVAATATVKQGAVEGANEDAVHGTMQLMLIQRQAEMMQKAVTVFNNDFDKTAVEQIARV